ncbi:hypothetical protein BDD12DRAFT_24559 [Trichophaea hybrida]|nr:hypothetical protein BDD12DRAFT_24559 [Trichophaea hybrida]
MAELQKNDSLWWRNFGDLSASRWANEPAPHAAVEGDRTFKNGTAFNHERPTRRVRKGSVKELGLSKGLEASRWASPNIPATLTTKEMAHIHPSRSARFRVSGSTNGNTNGLPHLTLNTQVSTVIAAEDIDVLMGENTPIEARIPVPLSAVLKDEDGDIIMQDLDDSTITSRIVEVVEGTRHGGFQAQPDESNQDPSYRVESVVEWVLVVDTSFILSHLHLVNNLVEAYNRWGNVVMLPWATIMELDGLKKSTSSIRVGTGGETTTVGALARRANNWCFEKMSKKEPGLWGQTKEETLDPTAVKGDAAILDCCR